ncbi:MAG TPA: hypothetical protein VG222_11070 [Vicinamibacterales bacterium]|jgi:hypothetical protein|nr:hypothetical protein [Vicinamibacterales bacterium]
MRSDSAPRLAHRAAALLIACVFLTLPTLSRLHDHLSTADNVAGFRLSKNIERPHERHSVAPLPTLASPTVRSDTSLAGGVAAVTSLAPPPVVVAPSCDRAPPAR